MSKRVLVVIDVQNEYFDGNLAIQYPSRERSLQNILQSIATAKKAGMPVFFIRHENPTGAIAFGQNSHSWEFHSSIEEQITDTTPIITKNLASVFDGTDLAQRCRDLDVGTVTLVGYMTNNCILGSAEGAVANGFKAEVLRDATGAIHMENEAGRASAEQVHETLMALLHSNFATVATTEAWQQAVVNKVELPKSNLVSTAKAGVACFNA
ncbi:MAG: isochorismatase family protein [Actinomycetaceae bacterium]|nr:isochorismatase family protein [Actinomycetaceae bacterium]MDO5746973.1 isochorismatase family protein [Actinomycetaceae bacterium]